MESHRAENSSILRPVLMGAALCWALGSGAAFAASSDIRGDGEITTTADGEFERNGPLDRFSMSYVNILYGPGLKDSSSYQPDGDGSPDKNRPVYMKNFLNLTYGFTENLALTGTFYFQYRPVLGQEFIVQDPFVRLSHSSIISTDWGLNLYSDARVHFGVTDASRYADMITGLQNFSYLSWQPGGDSRFLFALRVSSRYNIYGKHGAGTDVELYLGPEVNYQLAPTLGLTLLYEMGASHQFGDKADYFTNDGTDLQPGVSWDVTPRLNFNPYLNIQTGSKVSLATTSFGAFLSWTMF